MCDEQKIKTEKNGCMGKCRILMVEKTLLGERMFPVLSYARKQYFGDAACTQVLAADSAALREAIAATILQMSDFEDEVTAPITSCKGSDCECIPFEQVWPPRETTARVTRTLVRKLNITGIDAWVKFTFEIYWYYAEGVCVPKVN